MILICTKVIFTNVCMDTPIILLDNANIFHLVNFNMNRNNVGNRQKNEYQNGCFKKTKHAKFSEKREFLTCVCVLGGKKCSFFGKFGVLCFLETFVLRFALFPHYRR